MLKEHFSVFRRSMIFFDLCLVALAGLFSYFIRDNVDSLFPAIDYAAILPVYLFIWAIFLQMFDVYKSFRVQPITEKIFAVWKAALMTFVVFGTFTYIFKLHYISRSLIVCTTAIGWGLLSIEKILIIAFFRHIRRRGMNYRNLLIVGTGPRAQKFIDIIHHHTEWGFHIVGLVDEDSSKKGSEVMGYKVIGDFDDVPDIISNRIVDEAIFVVPRSWVGKIETVMHYCEAQGIKIHVAVDYFELKFTRAKQSDLGGFPLLSFESTPDKLWSLMVKRLGDIVVSGFALIVLSPLFLIVSIAIRATSKGPVFFRQQRSSINGRTFMLYKFRTMCADAEAKKEALLTQNEMQGPVFKITNDPRITSIGKFLRKTSIDELPQLWNVFRGDMSIVGPRPPLPSEVKEYDAWHRRRLSMRPGITCIWQVSGRNKIVDFDEWVKLDLEYIDNWSLTLDLKIFLKTFPVVLFGIGAK